jgi:hypothetical protein
VSVAISPDQLKGRSLNQLLKKPHYKAYLLRIWKEARSWRFSLEEVPSGKRRGFAGVQELMIYLSEITVPDNETEKNHLEKGVNDGK